MIDLLKSTVHLLTGSCDPIYIYCTKPGVVSQKTKKTKEKTNSMSEEKKTRLKAKGFVLPRIFGLHCSPPYASGVNSTLPDPSRSPWFLGCQQTLSASNSGPFLGPTNSDRLLWLTRIDSSNQLSDLHSHFFRENMNVLSHFMLLYILIKVIRLLRSNALLTFWPDRRSSRWVNSFFLPDFFLHTG